MKPLFSIRLLLLTAPLLCGSIPAATVTVTTTTDEVNGNTTSIANLIATPGGAGISLREAIIAANNTAGADTITLPAGTYTLTIANTGGVNEDGCLRGDLDVTDSLTITGAGAATTIVQAGTTAANGIDKVLAINPLCDHAVAFTMSGVTIRFGRNTQPYGAADFSFTGGGMDWCGNGAGSLTLTSCVISDNNNTDGYGGGLNIDEVAPATGVVTISNTRFSNNTSKYWGGGLNVFGDNVRVTISGSTIMNNNTLGTGGAGAQGGGINIRITNQNDGDGAPTPFVTIGNTTVSGNTGVGFGGGIDLAGAGNQDVTITNTAITGNSLIVVAGGVSNTTGGGLEHNNNAARTTTLSNVLIANNQSAGSATSNGGGLAHGAGNLIVRNSTISGNSTRSDGGGIYVTTDPALTLINTTISNNRADSDNNASGTGGGIRKLAGVGTVTLQNTISDGNFKGTGSTVDEVSGAVTANFSLIGNTTGATITGANNQLNVSGRLAALANNGGPSVGLAGFTAVLQTHGLLAGSPALDNGSNALVPAALTTDQRGTGFARILDAADADTTDEVDIGSYEAHPAVEDIANQTINEDGSFSVTVNLGDADLVFDSVTAVSGNTTLVPNNVANLSLSGSGSSRTLTVNPMANLFGNSTLTLTVTDTVAGSTQTMTDTLVLTVTEVNDAPTGTNDSLSTIAEDSGARTNSVASLLANDSQGPANESGQTLTMINVGSAVGGTVSLVGTNVVFTPTADFNGAASFVYTLQDNGTTAGVNDFKTSTATVSFTISEVNDAPGGVNDMLSNVLVNSGTRTNPFTAFLVNDSKGPANESGQVLTIISVGSAVGGAVGISGTDVLFTPASNYFGPAGFVYTLQDNGTTSGANDFKTSTATVSFNIIAVPPTITCPPDITTNTAPGGCRQTVAFSATVVAGVPPPTVTYQLDTSVITSPYAFSRGTNLVMVTASNGAPPNATCSFTVIVNDTEPPTIACSTNITVTTTGNCPAVVNFSTSGSDNCGSPTVVANPLSGSAFAVGTNTVNVTATDAAGNTNTCSFTVTVLPGPSPLLSISQSGTNVVLCWSNAFGCYALQYAPALISPPATNGWTNYPGPFTTNSGNIYVTNGIDAANRFFRLAF